MYAILCHNSGELNDVIEVFEAQGRDILIYRNGEYVYPTHVSVYEDGTVRFGPSDACTHVIKAIDFIHPPSTYVTNYRELYTILFALRVRGLLDVPLMRDIYTYPLRLEVIGLRYLDLTRVVRDFVPSVTHDAFLGVYTGDKL